MYVVTKELLVVAAISAISGYPDPEYERIIRELIKLGLSPSGSKNVDRAKLAEAQLNEQNQNDQKFSIQKSDVTFNAGQEKAEEDKIGATMIGDINKVLLGIK